MELLPYAKEAAECRRKALDYVGRPEATFLISVAREFERLDRDSVGLRVSTRQQSRDG